MSLHQLQENVLHELANAHGDILQNKVNSHSLMLVLEYQIIYFQSLIIYSHQKYTQRLSLIFTTTMAKKETAY